MKIPIIIDNGATFHMIKDQEFFTTLSQVSGKVILGDGKTSLSIQGVGTVKCIKGSHELILENVRYVPSLSESIYSLFLHIQHPGNEIHSLFEQCLFLTLPEFESQAIIGRDDLYLDAHPLFYQPSSTSSCSSVSINTVCHSTKNFQDSLLQIRLWYYKLFGKTIIKFKAAGNFECKKSELAIFEQSSLNLIRCE